MTGMDWLMLFLGAAAGAVGLTLLNVAFRALHIGVEDEHVALVTRFGKLVAKLEKPGFHFFPTKWLPWVSVQQVSMARDFRVIHDLRLNDAQGTTVVVDLWLELRVVDPEKALFAVEDWDKATQNLVLHAAMTILGSRDFQQILDDRSELGAKLQRDVSSETERWGVKVDQVFVRHVSLLPEVSRQVFGSVAARLERARAVVVEQGRLDVAQLEAETAKKVAQLVAEAKSQYPLAVGRALQQLKARPAVFDAYNALYELAQIRGARTVAFRGFDGKDLRALDAAMLPDAQPPAVRSSTNGSNGSLATP
jgi:regulator of protease activity HflC (stomatin/prohibitin superfamily)